MVSEASFYKRNPAKYGVAVGLTTGGVIILALVSLCCKYESNKVKIDNFEEATYSFATKFKCVLKIFHPLSAAFITMKSSALAVPRVYHMITLWIYIFAVVLSTLIGV